MIVAREGTAALGAGSKISLDFTGDGLLTMSIDESKELMLISDGGTLVRTRAAEVATTGRNAQGVRLIRLSDAETLVGVVSIEAVEDDEVLEATEEVEATEVEAVTSEDVTAEPKDDATEE